HADSSMWETCHATHLRHPEQSEGPYAKRCKQPPRCASCTMSRCYGAEKQPGVSFGHRFALGSSACGPLNDGRVCDEEHVLNRSSPAPTPCASRYDPSCRF